MKKEARNKDFIKGIIVGVIIVILIIIILYMSLRSGSSNLKNIIGEDIVFEVRDVHKAIEKDFPGKDIPVYDDSYCMKKFSERYSEEADKCNVSKIKTFSRLNPLVINVECICNS